MKIFTRHRNYENIYETPVFVVETIQPEKGFAESTEVYGIDAPDFLYGGEF